MTELQLKAIEERCRPSDGSPAVPPTPQQVADLIAAIRTIAPVIEAARVWVASRDEYEKAPHLGNCESVRAAKARLDKAVRDLLAAENGDDTSCQAGS